MNYKASTKDLLPTANDTPTLLSDLKNRLSTLTQHDIPFFLMPVRLETRFMRVRKNLLLESDRTPVPVKNTLFKAKELHTLLESVSGFRGFDPANATAFSTEIQAAGMVLNAFTESEFSQLSRESLQSSIEVLEEIQAAALAVQSNLPQPTGTSSGTDAINEALSVMNTTATARIGALQDLLNQEGYDQSWKDAVNPEFKNQLSEWISGPSTPLSDQIQQQPSHLDAYYIYLQEVTKLNQILSNAYGSELTDFDTAYFIEELRPILSSQLTTIYNGIDTLPTAEQAVFLPIAYEIGKRIQNTIQGTLIKSTDTTQLSRITASNNRTGLSTEPINSDALPAGILQLGSSLQNQTLQLETLAKSIALNNEPEPLDGLLNSYSSSLQGINSLLAAQPPLENEPVAAYIYGIVKTVDASINEVIRNVMGKEKTDSAFVLIDNIDKKGFETGYQLSRISGSDRFSTDVFNPTQIFEELWIRVYPDDIAINSHEKRLTTAEAAAGTAYWTLWGSSNGNPNIQLKAWQTIATTYGPERAAWIVKVTTPSNLGAITHTFSSVYQLYPQLSTLSEYTQQLSDISIGESRQTILSNPQWEIFEPSLDSARNKAKELRLPEPEFIQLNESFATFRNRFTTLSAYARAIPPIPGSGSGTGTPPSSSENPSSPVAPEVPFNLENTLQTVTAKINLLGDEISKISIIDRWPIADTPITGDIGDPKESRFSEASFTNVLPDRFLFATVNKYKPSGTTSPLNDPLFGSYTFGHIKIGNLVPAKLSTGIDPIAGTYASNALGQLQIDPQIKWMVDFKEAVRVGMGIEIPLLAGEFQKGFDLVLALGVKLGESNAVGDENQIISLGKNLLEDLLENHHYTPGGLAITEVGTPTNNTDQQSTDFNIQEESYKDSFAIEVRSPLFTPTQQQDLTKKRDGQLLSDALGINYAIFQHTKNAGGRQIANAVAMNRALYNGTIGSYMRDMMGFLFTDKNVANTKEYFTDYVLARGSVPGIRVGRQPYSILPSTAFGHWQWKQRFYGELSGEQFIGEAYTNMGSKLTSYMVQEYEQLLPQESDAYFGDRFNIRFGAVMEQLNIIWEWMSDWHVKNVNTKFSQQGKQQEVFLNIIGLEPTLAEAYSRVFSNSKLFAEEHNADPAYWQKYFNEFSSNLSWTGNGLDLPSLFKKLFKDYQFDTADYKVKHSSSNYLPSPYVINSGFLDPEEAKRGIPDITEFMGPAYPVNPYILDTKEVTEALRIFNVKFLEERFLLYGAKVAESGATPLYLPPYLGGNYINWLKNSSLEGIWKNNWFNSLPSRSLLFLLLRQSTLNTYKETAFDILEKDHVLRKTARKIIGSPEGVVMQQEKEVWRNKVLTKWDFLFESLQTLLSGDLENAVKYFIRYPIPYLNQGTGTEYAKNISSVGIRLEEFYKSLPNRGVNISPGWKDVKLSSYLKGTVQPSSSTILLDKLTNWNVIQSHQNALTQLSSCKTQELDKLLREHVDLCSYRLDAWNTGKVNKRLWENRKTDASLPLQPRKTGIYLGSYGWLFDVRSKGDTGIVPIEAKDLPDTLTNNPGNVYYDPENLGFIQTHSMTHALAAALLRAGYDSEKHKADNRFAINLSSERVGNALTLLGGIRNGQTLNALIGYEIERGLHEKHPGLELDTLIYGLRRKFSLVDPIVQSGTQATGNNSVRANLVLDGVKLINDIKSFFSSIRNQHPQKSLYQLYIANSTDSANNPFSQVYNSYASSLTLDNQPFLPLLSAIQPNDSVEALLQEIDKGMDSIDALGDLSVAEGVFQVARGNTERAGSVLQALAEGKIPADPELVKTPKNGIHIAHRVAVALEKKPAQFNPWPTLPLTPRALAEPSLNYWVAQILGAYQQGLQTDLVDSVGCQVTYTNLLGFTYTHELTLKELGLQPLDLLYTVTQNGFSDELDKRVRYLTRSKFSLLADAPIQIDYARVTTLPISFSDFHSLLFATQQLLTKAKPLEADDFISIASYPAGSTPEFDTASLQSQVNLLATSLNDLVQQAQAITAFSTDGLLAQGRAILLKASYFNLPQGIPESGGDSLSDQKVIEDLWKTFDSVRDTLLAKQSEVQVLTAQSGNLTGKPLVDNLTGIIKILLGDSFLTLPYFSLGKYQQLQNEVKSVLYPATPAQDILRNHASATELVDDWVFGLARVNEPLSYIETLRFITDADPSAALATGPLSQMRPAQLPHRLSGAQNAIAPYWLGAEYPQTYKPSGDTLSIALFDYNHLDLTTSSSYNCGLLLDNWDEVIPDAEITTGITFNYDQPSAKPPQTILLAVNPQTIQDLNPKNTVTTKRWSLEELLYTVLDTIDLSKMRLVEPDLFRKAEPNDTNPYTNVGASTQDIIDTGYFELFKWILPAVVGEITPVIDADKSSRYYAGKTDSVQQVSFDYNPNNDTPSKADGTAIDPRTTNIHNWDILSAREILEDGTTQGFLQEQETLGTLASLQQQLINQL